jgi:hypothetical protein
MADYPVQFSEVLPHLSAAEETWLRQQMQYVFVFGDDAYVEDEIPDDVTAADADWEGYRLRRDYDDEDLCNGELGFEYEIRDDDRQNRWERHLWFNSDGCGNPDCVADLVHCFLERFRPHECWSLSFALTCTKPEVGQFGGGGIFVTAKDTPNMLMSWITTKTCPRNYGRRCGRRHRGRIGTKVIP